MRAIQNTVTVFFQHSYITKPTITNADIVANAATKLIAAIKGNFAVLHKEMEIDALHRFLKGFRCNKEDEWIGNEYTTNRASSKGGGNSLSSKSTN